MLLSLVESRQNLDKAKNMSELTLYGISEKQCDTVKKARKWLEEQSIDFTFVDFRKDGINTAQVESWVSTLGWEGLINKRSTTWKELDEVTKASLDNTSIVSVLLESPTLIKRPLVDHKGELSVGFKAADFAERFAR